jgi:hypothetical protein
MKTPIYGLVAAQPKDVYGYLREQQGLKNLLGSVTRSDGTVFEAPDYAPVRANLTFSSISGTDLVVSGVLGIERVTIEGGSFFNYNVVTMYVATRGGTTIQQVTTEIKNAGYTSCEYYTIDADAYATAVGGTGDYTGATAYYRVTVRAGAGRQVQAPNLQLNKIPEVGQGGAGGEGGYEFTGGFQDRLAGQSGANEFGTFVEYTQAMADAQDGEGNRVSKWLRFGFSRAAQEANDSPYFPVSGSHDPSKGLFGGTMMPKNVTNLFDFDFNEASGYSADVSSGSLQYTAATGSLDFSECRVGDFVRVRFDFNIIPQTANTTVEVAIIWQTRTDDGTPTFIFPLTGTPSFYGTGVVGRTFLNRPTLSAYFASEEDVNARALLAIKADNPIQVAPLTTLVIIER